MPRLSSPIALVMLAALPLAGPAQPPADATATAGDPRQLVEMPDAARELMRKDMLDHLAALNEIIAHLAANDLPAAGQVAETRMGTSTMGKYRGSGMGPGRFMPVEMHSIGISMHTAASEFARLAKEGDLAAAYPALNQVMGTCVACHNVYRTR